MIIKGTLQWPVAGSYLGFDAEWTKNYKIKNGNIPFCFSLVAVERQLLDMKKLENGSLPFKYIQFFSEDIKETELLIEKADNCADNLVNSIGWCKLCGHQVISDFSVLVNMGQVCHTGETSNLVMLQHLWHKRKQDQYSKIVDTRYDVQKPFMGKSRRLVDICRYFHMEVTQQELQGSSMTRLQNLFWENKDWGIYERIAVMNIRHSLCSVLLTWLNEQILCGDYIPAINVNKIIYHNLQDDFSWIRSDEFMKLV